MYVIKIHMYVRIHINICMNVYTYIPIHVYIHIHFSENEVKCLHLRHQDHSPDLYEIMYLLSLIRDISLSKLKIRDDERDS